MAHPTVVKNIRRQLGITEPVEQGTETERLDTEELQGEESQEEKEPKTPTAFPDLPPLPAFPALPPLPQQPPAQLLKKRTPPTVWSKAASPTSQKPLSKLAGQARVVTVGGVEIDPADVTFGSLLKREAATFSETSPITCTVMIGQKVFVLKARSVDVIDNVINTKLLRALSIPGVQAPDTEELTPSLCASLAQKFQADSPNLVQALHSDIPSQLAEKAPGATLASLQENATKWDLLAGLAKDTDKLSPTKATRYLASKIQKPKQLEDANPGTEESNDSKSWDTAIKTLTNLGGLTGYKFGGTDHQNAVAELGRLSKKYLNRNTQTRPNFISQIGTDKKSARNLLSAKKAGQELHGQLVSWLKSPEGIAAFTGLAVADLVFGMRDRIMPNWAGANFNFDGKGLWAIDNAKNTTKEYNDSATGPQKIPTTTLTDDSNDEWKTGLGNVGVNTAADVAGSVFNYVYVKSKIYGLGVVDQAATLAVIKPVVTNTLKALVTLAQSGQVPKEAQQNLTARLQYLGAM
jgi:hypothetical protein